ncbi:pilus assembly FimT family protein [Lysobacter xanthus]
MPTSATCPRAEVRGFTLLELVVVLTIMGLAAAMAAPSLFRSIESWRARDAVEALRDQMHGLPAKARSSGRSIVLGETKDPPPFDVQPGWTVAIPRPWTVRANGYCEGGEVALSQGARTWTLRASAPFCDVEALP